MPRVSKPGTEPLKPKPLKRGRPTAMTQDVRKEICIRLADGESLRRICEDPGMPSRETVRKALRDDPEFVVQYARAREEQAETYADETIEIADTEGDPQRARVRIDARKWAASKLAPKKYGDRVAHEVSGPDGGPIEVESPRERIASRIAGLSARKGEGENTGGSE